jgi:3-dehydro-L-gulonate 2-dehydrogenase
MRIPFPELLDTLTRILLTQGFTEPRAALCARLFAETTLDGVYSHGLNRFPRFLRLIANGAVDIHASPALVHSTGALERWDGRRGPGNLNAHASMARAIALARTHGLGCVALSNTNHWMRGGSYGWQAAAAGFIGICFTNTMPNLPPWGGIEPTLGNNPLVIAVPRAEGPVVLDMAMSQFSYGALESYRRRGELLPVDGGFDSDGNLTRDPAAIEHSRRLLPAGFWKGSGLALLLDILAASLSAGQATHQIAPDPERETGLSQIFLALQPGPHHDTANRILASLGPDLRYPGQRILETRAENLARGVPVDPQLWQSLFAS